jgi:hypothetical protein
MLYAAGWRSNTPSPGCTKDDWLPDCWDEKESKALAHQIHTLSLLGVVYDIEIAGATLHATAIHNGRPVEFVAIYGDTHHQVLAYARERLPTVNHRTVVISRDRDNSRVNPKHLQRIIDAPENAATDDIAFTHPTTAQAIHGFASCRDAWQEASDSAAVRTRLDVLLGLS